jgi:uncharacterized protein YciI
MPNRRALIAAGVLAVSTGLAAAAPAVAADQPPTFFVFFHTPGPAWKSDVGFFDQAGIRDHVAYMGQFLAKGQLVMGGPFLDDSGGMMIMRAASMDEARARAEGDPTVKAGLLKVAVKPWLAAMIGKVG